MKMYGVEMKDAGYKHEEGKSVAESPTPESKPCYPTMTVEEDGRWNCLPLSLEGFKAGDKALLVALVNIKEKTKREFETEDDKESTLRGEIEFLKVGMKLEKSDEVDQDEDKLKSLLSGMKDE